MNIGKKWLIGGLAGVAVLGAGASLAVASVEGENDKPITGDAL